MKYNYEKEKLRWEKDKLLEENRIEDCKRIAKDPEFCQHLMEEFGIE